MIEPVIALLDGIGAVGFLAATVLAYRNWQRTHTISAYWMVFAIATGIGTIWAAVTALEKVDVYPLMMDAAVGPLLAAMATAFVIAALLTQKDIIGPTE